MSVVPAVAAGKQIQIEAIRPEKEYVMLKNFDEVQKLGQANTETATKAFGVISSGIQSIATEVTDYSKKSFEDGSKFLEQLRGTKSVEKAIELHQGYVKSAYEGFVAQATKIGGLYADLAKETYKPLEGFVAKNTPAK